MTYLKYEIKEVEKDFHYFIKTYIHVNYIKLLFFVRECLINNYDDTPVNVQNSLTYFKQDVIIGIVSECRTNTIA